MQHAALRLDLLAFRIGFAPNGSLRVVGAAGPARLAVLRHAVDLQVNRMLVRVGTFLGRADAHLRASIAGVGRLRACRRVRRDDLERRLEVSGADRLAVLAGELARRRRRLDHFHQGGNILARIARLALPAQQPDHLGEDHSVYRMHRLKESVPAAAFTNNYEPGLASNEALIRKERSRFLR